ncbi:hypothetical protein EVAR_51720_1 [Eumeta japonica]|uniref:Uncharacterized protein n=1 Tax=Eumeta variegata TaxID=151549 RepID=A0A4C1XH95_EUMVA|nr:hypothetical protein EVAR_51720_1 [Eumeta japonica]
MDTRNNNRITSVLPDSWEKIGYLMQGIGSIEGRESQSATETLIHWAKSTAGAATKRPYFVRGWLSGELLDHNELTGRYGQVIVVVEYDDPMELRNGLHVRRDTSLHSVEPQRETLPTSTGVERS